MSTAVPKSATVPPLSPTAASVAAFRARARGSSTLPYAEQVEDGVYKITLGKHENLACHFSHDKTHLSVSGLVVNGDNTKDGFERIIHLNPKVAGEEDVYAEFSQNREILYICNKLVASGKKAAEGLKAAAA